MSIISIGGSWEKSLDNNAIWKGTKFFVRLEAQGLLRNIYLHNFEGGCMVVAYAVLSLDVWELTEEVYLALVASGN